MKTCNDLSLVLGVNILELAVGVLGGILALLILVFVLLVAISFFVVCKVNGLRLVNRDVSIHFTEN